MSIARNRYLSTDEAKRLRSVVEARAVLDLAAGRTRGPLLWALVDLALSTGLRVSELALLTVGDLDARRSILSVWRLKRRKPCRDTIEMPPPVVKHWQEFVAWKRAAGQAVDDAAPLFVGKRGALTAQGLMRAGKVAVAMAGLPPEWSIHTARHPAGVHMLQVARNLQAVRRLLGHKSIQVTAEFYGDIPAEDMQRYISEMHAAQND